MSFVSERPFEWLEARSGSADFSAGERRRRAYLCLCLFAVAGAVLGFAIVDGVQGRSADATRSTVVAAFLAAMAFLLRKTRDLRQPTRAVIVVGLVVITWESAQGGEGAHSFLWLYVMPLAIFFVLRRREAAVWTLLCAASLAWTLWVADRRVTPDGDLAVLALATFGLCALLGHGLETARRRILESLRRETAELEAALADVETLHGLVPICAECKRTRDDQGYWENIESYLTRHASLELRPAFCPDCASQPSGDPAALHPSDAALRKRHAVRSDSTAHDRHRRFYFAVGLAVLIPFLGYFGSLDIRAGRHLESALVYGLALLFIGVLIALFRGRNDRRLYQLASTAALIVLAYELHVGAYGGYVFLWLYSFPAFTIFLLGTEGVRWSAAAFGIAAVYHLTPLGYPYDPSIVVRFLATYFLVIVTCAALEALRHRSHERLLAEQAALRQAIAQVQTLRGLLPLCPSCKKVRDDRGFWQQIETHLSRVSTARFSHGLCPDCEHEALAEIDAIDDIELPHGIGAGADGSSTHHGNV